VRRIAARRRRRPDVAILPPREPKFGLLQPTVHNHSTKTQAAGTAAEPVSAPQLATFPNQGLQVSRNSTTLFQGQQGKFMR
jgi:hypothetical protein